MVSGLRILCIGNPFCRVRDDLFRCCERNMFAAVRHHNEVHWTIPVDGARIRRPLDTHLGPHRMATSSQQSQAVLHNIGTLGCR